MVSETAKQFATTAGLQGVEHACGGLLCTCHLPTKTCKFSMCDIGPIRLQIFHDNEHAQCAGLHHLSCSCTCELCDTHRMADDLERAILFTFDQTGRVDAQLKAKAVNYCDEVIQNPACLALCIERFGSSSYMEVRFWCLQTLHEVGAAIGLFKAKKAAVLSGAALLVTASACRFWPIDTHNWTGPASCR